MKKQDKSVKLLLIRVTKINEATILFNEIYSGHCFIDLDLHHNFDLDLGLHHDHDQDLPRSWVRRCARRRWWPWPWPSAAPAQNTGWTQISNQNKQRLHNIPKTTKSKIFFSWQQEKEPLENFISFFAIYKVLIKTFRL